MGRLVLAVLLLSLGLAGRASASNKAAASDGQAAVAGGAPPLSQPERGVANKLPCLNENSARGQCGGGGPLGITYVTTSQNWTQTISSRLTGGTEAKVTLTPCPAGIDTSSGSGYQVFISGGGKSEAVNVLSGSCVSGVQTGTIAFTPYYSYPAGSTIGSASSGIQETVNIACGTNKSYAQNGQCNVILPANGGSWQYNTYNVYGTIVFHSYQSTLSGYGVALRCWGRGPCLQVGDLLNTNHSPSNTIAGISFRTDTNYSSNPSYEGVKITNTVAAGGSATITTAPAHGFRVGDMVTILFTDDSSYWGDCIITAVTETTFSCPSGLTLATQTTPGVVALAYSAILDNGNGTHLVDLSYDLGGEVGHFNNFFDMWDDENATIDHFNNSGISLNSNANWTGSFIFSGGARHISHQIAPVITLRDSTITANYSNGVTVYNSNGLYIENTVIQATGPWEVYSSNSTGNYQGAYLKNIYSESEASANPLSPARSPFPGLGIAGLIIGPSTSAASFQFEGNGGLSGAFPSGGTGSMPYSYFIVANDTTAGTQTSPMQVLNWKSSGSDPILVRWPRVANGTDTITYDVLRMKTPLGVGAVYPHTGGCPGGSGDSCGYVAKGLSQSAACSGGLVCIYRDDGSSATSPYTIKQGDYGGNLLFWPGAIVSVSGTVTVDTEKGPVVGVGLKNNPIQVSTRCSGYGVASSGGYTSCLASLTSANNSVPNQTATVVSDGDANTGGNQNVTKGRLNFTSTPFTTIQPHHIITLIDSQPALTQATTGYRPLASANDTWIGTDVPARGVGLDHGQLAFGAPVSITNYIGATGDSARTDWLERLTSTQKTFAVPVKISAGNNFTLGDGTPLSEMRIYRMSSMPASKVPPQSCIDKIGQTKGLTKSDQITSITPPGKLGNLSLNAYAGDDGAIVLHFCNPSASESITPSGAYSFLAVR